MHATAPDNTFAFPFNQRWLMVFWSMLFSADARFAPNSDRSPEWNGGAYIAEARAQSTFLRSVGLAQMMMQSGLFVGAEAFGANIVRGVFTHCKREEDTSMTGGKFDDELSRMNALGRHA
jgi:hypothetical protein